jgi:hypothetical protein
VSARKRRREEGKRICLFPHPSQQHDFFYRHLHFKKNQRTKNIKKERK